MNAVDAIAESAKRTGYREEAIVRNYAFADVLGAGDVTRVVPIAAFTHTPPSYRSAALAAVSGSEEDVPRWVNEHRSLGAPLLFVTNDDRVSLWQVRSAAPPRVLQRLSVNEIPGLFAEHQRTWRPEAIHRAKAIGAIDEEYQLDFVDVGLMPAVEGEVHVKLDRLLSTTLKAASEAAIGGQRDTRVLFRLVFRLLAAKVLQDRGHPYAASWKDDDLASLLQAIESYYSLSAMPGIDTERISPILATAWNCLRHGINFSNISSDDLAFVYENTLVTRRTRKALGTHRTPRQVAEYAVSRLELYRHSPEDLRIYEPFTGSGTFLVSALRHLRDVLPPSWSDEERHKFLVRRVAGDELDIFAREVAALSLILADYPNKNSWQIGEGDLFEDGVLRARMRKGNIVLCNPPFEDFSVEERDRYGIASQYYSKPAAALNAALDSHPLALGFVLPRSFILHRKFDAERRRVEELYQDVELVGLPDDFFGASRIESALLVARERRRSTSKHISLRSTEVGDRDRRNFLRIGKTTSQRVVERSIDDPPSGELWIPALQSVWDYLKAAPRMREYFSTRWGIRWKSEQGRAWSDTRRPGYRKGLHTARGMQQFQLTSPVYLDCREERLAGNAANLPWNEPKVLVNAARISRGPWRFAAALDTEGLVCSQQLFGLWPRQSLTEQELLTLVAILNGPVANAFLTVKSPTPQIRSSVVGEIPMPDRLPVHVGEAVVRYQYEAGLVGDSESSGRAEAILTHIDASVLAAYNLPPFIEQQLLTYFWDATRPIAHRWRHWDEQHPGAGLKLSERVLGSLRPHDGWIGEVFKPLPREESELFDTYGGGVGDAVVEVVGGAVEPESPEVSRQGRRGCVVRGHRRSPGHGRGRPGLVRRAGRGG